MTQQDNQLLGTKCKYHKLVNYSYKGQLSMQETGQVGKQMHIQ